MKSLKGATAISGMIMFIILGATTFSQILSFSGATEGLVSAILGQGLSTFAVVTLMMLILIFLGIFVDQVSMMLITLPVFMPIVAKLGVDPDLVRRAVSHLHAARAAAAAARPPAHDHARRRTASSDDGAHLPGRRAVCDHEPAVAGLAAAGPDHRHVAAELAHWISLCKEDPTVAAVLARDLAHYGARRCFGLLGTANFKISHALVDGRRRAHLGAP
jgi:hypothetical protein